MSGNKSSGKIKRISIPRVQSSTDTELQSQSGSTPLQPTALHYAAFRTDPDESVLPPTLRCRLFELFQQIEKEFEVLYTENLGCMNINFFYIIFIISIYNFFIYIYYKYIIKYYIMYILNSNLEEIFFFVRKTTLNLIIIN